MKEIEKSALARKGKITVKKVGLHSKEHTSFHFELNDTESFNLLYTMSIKQWELENGKKASTRVDKSKVRIIKLKDK